MRRWLKSFGLALGLSTMLICGVGCIEEQLPRDLTVSFGEDASTSCHMSWWMPGSWRASGIALCEGEQFDAYRSVFYLGVEQKGEEALGGEHGRWMEVCLSSLQPDTTYTYRVGSEDEGKWIDGGTFRTAPQGEAPFSFIFLTDSQGETLEDATLVGATFREAKKTFEDARFILHGGDHVDLGYDELQWQWYMKETQDTRLQLPIMPVVGNHDVLVSDDGREGLDLYKKHFSLPTNGEGGPKETVYSFNYGAVHFVALNTEVDTKGLQAQLNWLKEDVVAANKRWNIVCLHKGPYLSMRDRLEFREVIGPVFDELGIDLVLQGHDHSYMRTVPLKNQEEDPLGTTYIIGNSCGYKFYDGGTWCYQSFWQQPYEQTYLGFEVTSDAIIGKAYTINGELIDAFELK